MYEIEIENSVEKDLRKIPQEYFKTIISKIKLLANNPHPKGSKKLKDSSNFWRIRINNYRVIYEITESPKIIRIYKISHRKDIYR